MGEFSTPHPFFLLSPFLSFFSYPSNIDCFYYIITKIHPHFKTLDPRLRVPHQSTTVTATSSQVVNTWPGQRQCMKGIAQIIVCDTLV